MSLEEKKIHKKHINKTAYENKGKYKYEDCSSKLLVEKFLSNTEEENKLLIEGIKKLREEAEVEKGYIFKFKEEEILICNRLRAVRLVVNEWKGNSKTKAEVIKEKLGIQLIEEDLNNNNNSN